MEQRIHDLFRTRFGRTPLLVRSPGRVNLIGEHTDYNEGFVLPGAVDKAMIFAVARRDDRRLCWHAADLAQDFETTLDALQKSPLGWPNYLTGTVDQLQKAGLGVGGFDCMFGGDIPVGAGMSSSAAIEAGLAFALNEIFRLGAERMTLVKLAQKAENEFVGVRCGIMDQFINIFGKPHRVVRLDCRSLDYEYVPFERDDIRIILCDTRVKHDLATSEYNVRRHQCEEGVRQLQNHVASVKSLRDVPFSLLEECRSELDPVVYRRCAFVILENERVLAGCEDLSRNDVPAFGRKMYASHAGLRDEYQVSCAELDVLVDLAAGIDGVLGARMMGGGFGGCTINLVEDRHAAAFSERITSEYHARTGRETKLYQSRISAGTAVTIVD